MGQCFIPHVGIKDWANHPGKAEVVRGTHHIRSVLSSLNYSRQNIFTSTGPNYMFILPQNRANCLYYCMVVNAFLWIICQSAFTGPVSVSNESAGLQTIISTLGPLSFSRAYVETSLESGQAYKAMKPHQVATLVLPGHLGAPMTFSWPSHIEAELKLCPAPAPHTWAAWSWGSDCCSFQQPSALLNGKSAQLGCGPWLETAPYFLCKKHFSGW